MLNIIKNKKGMSLPIILAISSFFIISVFILTTVVLYQAKAREADFNYQQEYSLTQSKINATIKAIIRNDDLSNDFLNDLSDFLDVEITQYDSSTVIISSNLKNGSLVKSYLSKSTESISLVDEYLVNDGFEDDFELNPLITPASILSNYLKEYFSNNFDDVSFVGNFQDIDEIVKYIKDLASRDEGFTEVDAKVLTKSSNPTVSGHWYINGNVKLGNNINLTIPEGYILFIDGNLTLGKRAILKGAVVVNGDVTINGDRRKYETVKATIYMSGKFDGSYKMYFGNSERPTFIFSEENIVLKKRTSGYAYLLAKKIRGAKSYFWSYTDIIGGVYSDNIKNISSFDVRDNSDLDESKLYDYGVSTYIENTSGEDEEYLFTYPK